MLSLTIYNHWITASSPTNAPFSGRNLLNKKEAGPVSTIKESSESSQTLDEQDAQGSAAANIADKGEYSSHSSEP